MTALHTVTVPLDDRAYAIEIGPDLLETAGRRIAPLLPRKRTAVVTDETVAGHHLDRLITALSAADVAADVIVLPAGEATKSFGNLETVLDRLLEARLERDDLLVAFGGGVIGDLAGFAAAVLRRGIGFVQIPTTLLAQVDSSVGGKTGINTRHGKNLVGAFHQPKLVLCDVGLLDTLAPRDLLAGYGEVAKYGLLGDAEFFAWLETNGPALRDGDGALRAEAVRKSCQMKADIVARDETERGDRALLNLGHTFGHALEAATGYSDRLLHGEAVAIGCALAFEASARMGLCAQEDPSRVRAHFETMGMPRDLATIPGDLPDVDGLIDLMMQDKKVRQGRPVFILARGIGDAFVSRDADMDAIRTVLRDGLADRT